MPVPVIAGVSATAGAIVVLAVLWAYLRWHLSPRSAP